MKLLRRLHLCLNCHSQHVKTVIRNFVPVFVGRGVVQISAYVDALLASLLPTGAVAALAYAQTLYTLPVSLFGMSVSAAELALMSGELGDKDQVAAALRTRLDAGLRRIAFFVTPSVAAFLVLGDVIVAAIYQTGQFMRADVLYVWGILAGATVGLLASTCGRLYASAYYALHDTRTPLRYAVVRVALTTVLGYVFALHLPAAIGIATRWGVAGLTVSAGIAAWIEFILLRRSMNRRIGRSGLAAGYLAKIWAAALAAAGIGWVLRNGFGSHPPVLQAIVVLPPYGLAYFAIAWLLGLPEARDVMRYLRPR
jgi:putative peptidoglycan lipid II flippase